MSEVHVRRRPAVASTIRRDTPAMLEGGEYFAGYVAHELRAPIALQRAMVEVTLANPNADTAALREMGARVVASCMWQQRLIDGLLELVRSGRGLTRQAPVDIAATTAAVLAAHDLSQLDSVVALERVRTIGDPDLLERLIDNLVSNAIRHNVTGGRIEVTVHAESARAVLCVANTGPPIPAGELERLFQPFQRLASQPPKTAQGVGLGLAVVRAIADAHHAFVTARARAGGGLEMRVSFPATHERGAEHGAASHTDSANGFAPEASAPVWPLPRPALSTVARP